MRRTKTTLCWSSWRIARSRSPRSTTCARRGRGSEARSSEVSSRERRTRGRSWGCPRSRSASSARGGTRSSRAPMPSRGRRAGTPEKQSRKARSATFQTVSTLRSCAEAGGTWQFTTEVQKPRLREVAASAERPDRRLRVPLERRGARRCTRPVPSRRGGRALRERLDRRSRQSQARGGPPGQGV